MFDQSPYECRFDWGVRGTDNAADRGDIIIIVDVLSFSSTTVTAVNYGARVFPYASYTYGEFYAKQVGAEMSVGRKEAKEKGGRSLSPLSFTPEDRGKAYVLYSPNGATCSRHAHKSAHVLLGSLLNGSAVSKKAEMIQKETGLNITVIACGEHWSGPVDEEKHLRPCIEDYLGAGAILSKLSGSKSPEAEVCINAFKGSQDKIADLIRNSGSGRELEEAGFGEDVTFSSRLDICSAVPKLYGEHFEECSNL